MHYKLPAKRALCVKVHSRDQPDANLLVEHLQHFLARATLEQLAMHLQTLDGFLAPFSRPQLHRGVFRGVVLARLRQLGDDMVDFVHQRIGPSVQSGSDTVVQHVLKALLFAHDGVQEVGAVDVQCLVSNWSVRTNATLGDVTYQFLIKVHLYHRLYGIANVHQLEKLQKGRNAARLFMLLWMIGLHLLRGPKQCQFSVASTSCQTKHHTNIPIKSRTDVPLTKCLQQQHKNLFNRIPYAVPILPWISCERLRTLQRLTISVNELQSNIKREQ